MVGALRSSLIGQFMSESILTSLLAVSLALGMVSVAVPGFQYGFLRTILTLNLADKATWLGMLV